jgi:uncharacterized membrane protein
MQMVSSADRHGKNTSIVFCISELSNQLSWLFFYNALKVSGGFISEITLREAYTFSEITDILLSKSPIEVIMSLVDTHPSWSQVS